jgi:hypothetical protein
MKKQLLMTSEVAFSLKHYFLIKNSLLGAGNLAPVIIAEETVTFRTNNVWLEDMPSCTYPKVL